MSNAQRSLIHVLGWATLVVLSFFFKIVGLVIVSIFFFMKCLEAVHFIQEERKANVLEGEIYDDHSNRPGFEQPTIPGT